MSLSIRDIERSIGVDLLRRPFVTHVISAYILRFYVETLAIDPDSPTPDDDDTHSLGLLERPWFVDILASLIVILVYLIAFVGIFEALFWISFALITKLVRAPRIYVFEKLVLDLRVALLKSSVRYVEKTIKLHGLQTNGLPQFRATRSGVGGLVITTLTVADTLSREAMALFKLLRYMNSVTLTYFSDDMAVFVGSQTKLMDALTAAGGKQLTIDLGWHRDVVEKTTFKLCLHLTRDAPQRCESVVKFVGRRVVAVEVQSEVNMEALELMGHSMEQFAAVCEAGVRGRRFFNGKRLSIYGIGLILALSLIVLYEGLPGLLKPTVDVLTLAVGAYTLWMTVGKSAALGDTVEEIHLVTNRRHNILLAFHGLAHLHRGVINTCWIPEIHRPLQKNGRDNAGSTISSRSSSLSSPSSLSSTSVYEIDDGSISVLEAAICLSVFEHFGHFIKWKGENLLLEQWVLEEGLLAHVKRVVRIKGLDDLQYAGLLAKVLRIGGRPNSKGNLLKNG